MTVLDARTLHANEKVLEKPVMGRWTIYQWQGRMFRKGTLWYGIVSRDGKQYAKLVTNLEKIKEASCDQQQEQK